MNGEPILNDSLGFLEVIKSCGDNNAFLNVERKIRKITSFFENRKHNTKQFETSKRTPNVVCAPPKGGKRGSRGLNVMIFILDVLKEGEKGVGSDRKQEASGGAALDDAYKDEI